MYLKWSLNLTVSLNGFIYCLNVGKCYLKYLKHFFKVKPRPWQIRRPTFLHLPCIYIFKTFTIVFYLILNVFKAIFKFS